MLGVSESELGEPPALLRPEVTRPKHDRSILGWCLWSFSWQGGGGGGKVRTAIALMGEGVKPPELKVSWYFPPVLGQKPFLAEGLEGECVVYPTSP